MEQATITIINGTSMVDGEDRFALVSLTQSMWLCEYLVFDMLSAA